MSSKPEESKKEEETKIYNDIDKIQLKNEKDFKELANNNIEKIKASLDPTLYTFSFLKESIEMLGPSLDSEKLSDLQSKIDVVLKSKKTKGEDLKKKNAPVVSTQRADKVVLQSEYGGNDEKKEEEEYNEDDDFM